MRLYSLLANSEYRTLTVAGPKSNPQIVLRTEELVVLLRLALERGPALTYATLAAELGMTASEVQDGYKRQGLGRGLPCRIREDHGARLRHARLLPKGRRFRPPQSRAQAFPVSRHLSGEICADPCPRHRTSAPPTGLLGGKNWEMKVAKVRKLEQTIAASGAGILEP